MIQMPNLLSYDSRSSPKYLSYIRVIFSRPNWSSKILKRLKFPGFSFLLFLVVLVKLSPFLFRPSEC